MTNLKKAWCAMNLSSKEAAKRIGISPAAMSQMEKRGIFSVTTAKKYACALGCNPFDLLEDLD